MTAAIEHVHFLCADPETTSDFFKLHLDAEEIERVNMPDWMIIRLRIGAGVIALSPKRAIRSWPTLRRLLIVVSRTSD